MRKDAATRSDERIRTEVVGPCDQLRRWKGLDSGANLTRVTTVGLEKCLERLAVRQIESAAAGEQKFSRNRRHALVDRHAMTVACDNLRREEAGRTCSNDGDVADYCVRLFAHHVPVFDIDTRGSFGGKARWPKLRAAP